MKPMIRRLTLTAAFALLAGVAIMPAQARQLTRVATMIDGAEVTGLSANGLGEIFLNVQHPEGKNALKQGDVPTQIGYMADFDPATFSGEGVAIPPKGQRDRVYVASGEYVVLARAGEPLGSGQVLGGVYDSKGKLMYVSNAPDFNGFVPLGANSAYLYTAWEGAGRDGASAVSRLKLVRVNGRWQADLKNSRMMDLRAIDGTMVMCSGTVSPWGTPLMTEEYFFYNTAVWNHPDNHDEDERPGYKGGNDVTYIKPKTMNRYIGGDSNPYRYGYVIEVNGAAGDKVQFVKHYAMGRFSHETVAIMPDMRTTYLTDDDSPKYINKKYNTASGGVLFKFVADRKGDLSAGTLYAAKLKQDAGKDPQTTGFDVSWIRLAHGTDGQIAAWIAEYDGIGVKDYVEGKTNYISNEEINDWAEGKLQRDLNGDGRIGSYKDDRPAFLESRRAAAALGASNEWDKLEGATALGNKVYIAASSIGTTMTDGYGSLDWATGARDKNSQGDIALNKESCGGVYVAETGSDYNMNRLDPFVIGRNTEGKQCDVNLPASPDNILATADGSLLIGEDAGSKRHPVDMLWLVRDR